MMRPGPVPLPRPARCGVLTLSDVRTVETDPAGSWLKDQVPRHGHQLAHYSVVSEDVVAVRTAVQTLVHGRRVDVLMTVGSTGVGPRDCALEALSPLVEAPMPGFGELLRALSFEAIGPAAMLTRASGCRVGPAFVFCLPSAREAVVIAWERLILPELDHLVAMLGR